MIERAELLLKFKNHAVLLKLYGERFDTDELDGDRKKLEDSIGILEEKFSEIHEDDLQLLSDMYDVLHEVFLKLYAIKCSNKGVSNSINDLFK